MSESRLCVTFVTGILELGYLFYGSPASLVSLETSSLLFPCKLGRLCQDGLVYVIVAVCDFFV